MRFDPVSHLGQTVLSSVSYEPDTIRLFRDKIRPGAVVIYIGANEGFLAALAASLAGAEGMVVAVEPQARFHDVLEINLALNAAGRTHIVKRVVAERDDEAFQITLFPVSNTGASSLVRNYAFGARKVAVALIMPAPIFEQVGMATSISSRSMWKGSSRRWCALAPLLERGAVG